MTSNATTTSARKGDPFFKSVETMRMLIKDSRKHLSSSPSQQQQQQQPSSSKQGSLSETAQLAKELQATNEKLDEANRRVKFANQKVDFKEDLIQDLKQQLAAANQKAAADSDKYKKELDEKCILLENKVKEEGLLKTKVIRLEAELENMRKHYEELKDEIEAQKYDEDDRVDDDDDSSSVEEEDDDEVEAEEEVEEDFEEQSSKKRGREEIDDGTDDDNNDDDEDNDDGDKVEAIGFFDSEPDPKQVRIDSSEDEEAGFADGFINAEMDIV